MKNSEYLEDFAGLREPEKDDFGAFFEDFEAEKESTQRDFSEAKAAYESKYNAGDIAEMEALAEAIIASESEAEADAFLGAIASIASRVLPKAFSIGKKVLPGLIRGARMIVNKVGRSPEGRQIIRALPKLMRNTAADVLQKVADGKPISGDAVMRSLAGQAGRLIKNTSQREAILQEHGYWVHRMREVCRRPNGQSRRCRNDCPPGY
jgi:hypothetical protein